MRQSILERQSNMELLRIVAMSMIVIHHFMVHGRLDVAFGDSRLFLIESFTMLGVDIFVMISGWFLIKLSLKSVVRLATTVIFFSIVSYVIFFVVKGHSVVSLYYFASFLIMPFTHSEYWFVKVYFILMLLAPILNEAIKNFSKERLCLIVGLLLFANFYSCCLGGNKVDDSGYNIFNFICCYMSGACISKMNLKSIPNVCFIMIIVASILCLFISIYVTDIHNHYTLDAFINYRPFKYSSPFIFLPALALTALLGKTHVKSQIINKIASCSLGVYLLQDGWARELGYNFIMQLEGRQLYEKIIGVTALFIGLWVLSYLCYLIMNPVIQRVQRIASNVVESTVSYAK